MSFSIYYSLDLVLAVAWNQAQSVFNFVDLARIDFAFALIWVIDVSNYVL
jgi:hypothetical protein